MKQKSSALSYYLLDKVTRLRNVFRGFLLSLMGIPCLCKRKVLLMELFSWALCRRSRRYRKGNLFFEKRGLLDTFCYGETPLVTLERIARLAGINENTRIMDLGCGAGKAAVYFALTRHCRAVGIERNPELVALAERLANGCRLEKSQVTFIEEDMFVLPVQKVDMVYIYQSSLDDESIKKLAQQMLNYEPRVKIITTSYAFEEILPGAFVTEQVFDGWFPWGLTWVYVQRTVKNPENPTGLSS